MGNRKVTPRAVNRVTVLSNVAVLKISSTREEECYLLNIYKFRFRYILVVKKLLD